MKELIEKIKELRQNPYSEYERLSHNKAIDEILNIIQEQELKPFNPVECGFILNDSFNKEYPYKVYYNEDKQGYFEIADCGNNSFKLTGIQPLIKIPNHRQGVELLRNLGVIE
jgi:hypothetical protein